MKYVILVNRGRCEGILSPLSSLLHESEWRESSCLLSVWGGTSNGIQTSLSLAVTIQIHYSTPLTLLNIY